MSFQPLSSRIYIKPDPAPEMIGRIHVPKTAADKLRRDTGMTGIVRYMGPGMLRSDGTRWPMPDVAVGSRVIYLDQPWPEVEIAGEKLVQLRDDAVLAEVTNNS
jgi:co-chaperonin GroES (HSP10)